MSGGRANLFVVGVVLCWGVGVTCAAETPAADDPFADKTAPGRDLQLEILPAPPPLKPGEADSPEAAIRRALDARVRAELVDVPLNVLCDEIGKKLNIPVLLDRKALSDDGVDPETPLSRSVSNARLRSVLDLTLDDIDLTWTIDNEVLLITTETQAHDLLKTRVYDVTDLAFVPEYECSDMDSLIEMITSTISPSDWSIVGGDGSIEPLNGDLIQAIVVSQPLRVHYQIEELFADLRTHASMNGEEADKDTERNEYENAQKPEGVKSKCDEAISQQDTIRKALQKKISIDYDMTPLFEVIDNLKELMQVDIQLHKRSLEDEGLDVAAPVSLKVSDISAASALDLILRDLDLSYVIEDNFLLILTVTEERERLSVKVYNVSDKAFADLLYIDLINSITSTIHPESWSDVGGEGSITQLENAGMKVILVSQTQLIHNEIEKLLANLRKVRHKEKAAPRKQSGQEAPDLGHGGTGIPAPVMNGFHSMGERSRNTPGLGRGFSRSPVKLKPDPDRDAFVASNNRFAFDLYAKLREENRGENLFFSPLGISTAMAMTQAGARGRTADEIARAMYFTLPPLRLHPACRSLTRILQDGSACELNIANRLWVQSGFSLRDGFMKTTRECYGSECGEVDFVKNREAAAAQINAWVEQETNKRIRNLVASDTFDDLTRFVLTNTVYFRGKWTYPFYAEATKPDSFFADSGRKQVMFMSMKDLFCRYAEIEDADLQIVEKYYHPSDNQSHDLSMLILLPKHETKALEQLEKRLSSEQLADWCEQLSQKAVDISLPKYHLETDYSISESLVKLGICSAFDPTPGGADFSGISDDDGLYLQSILHKAFIDVNESGSEAAAASAAIGALGSTGILQSEKIVFCADHPFIFLIRDNRTGCILFLGRVCDPEST